MKMTPWMQRSRATLFSLGFVVSAAACGQAQVDELPSVTDITSVVETPERTFFEQLLNTPYVGTQSFDATPVDFAQAFADMPEEISLSTGDVSVAADGATVVESFALFHNLDGTPVGIEAEQVLFYNFNPSALAERFRGNNLGAEVKVADRIELRGVKTIGMEAVSAMMLREYIDTIDDLTSADGELVTELNAMDVFSYNFGIKTMLIEGFTLHPFTFVAPIEHATEAEDASDETEESLDELYQSIGQAREDRTRSTFQALGAFARSFSVDALAYESLTADYAMRIEDIDMSMVVEVGVSGLRGYDRGDLDFYGSWDAGFGGALPIPDETGETEVLTVLPMVGGVKSSTLSGLRLGQAFEALANWEIPSKDVTDFLDLGRWETTNYRLDMGGETLFNSEKIVFDSDFHWLLPTALELTLSDTGYDIGNLFSVMTEQLGDDLDADITPEQLRAGLDIADQYGFDCFCGDYSLNFTWDEETGAMGYRESGQLAEAFSGQTSVNLGFTTPADIAGLFEAEDPETALQMMLLRDFEFRSLNWQMNDLGGLTNLFEMLHAIGLAFPEEDGMAILTYNQPEQLRMLAVNSVIGMKPFVRQQVPGLDPWMDALAGFLKEGGSLSIGANPETPVTAPMVAVLATNGGEPDPEQIIDMFGLTVTHTK